MTKYDLGIKELARKTGVLIDSIKLLHRNEDVAARPMDDATRVSTRDSVQYAIELLEEMKTFLDPEYTLALRYIGCCSVDYLTDHLHGDDEELVSIYAGSEMTTFDIETLLCQELPCNDKFGDISEKKLSELASSISGDAWRSLTRTLAATDDCTLPDDTRLWFTLTW